MIQKIRLLLLSGILLLGLLVFVSPLATSSAFAYVDPPGPPPPTPISVTPTPAPCIKASNMAWQKYVRTIPPAYQLPRCK
jgi:hypothetical protein